MSKGLFFTQVTRNFDYRGAVKWLAISLLVVVSAMFFGLVAVTGNYLIVTVAAGLLLGGLLVAKPDWNITLIVVVGSLSGFVTSFLGPSLSKISWGVSMLGFLLWVPAVIGLLTTRRVPFFVWLGIGFILYAIAVTVTHWYSFSEFAAGFKRYFQAIALLFALGTLTFNPGDFRRWKKILLGIALLQLPFALYEVLILVPERGGLAAGGDVTDVVAGSFGANLAGGSANAEMATFLLIAYSFLFARWREKQLAGGTLLLLTPFLLAPLFMGETKIIVVMLPLVGFILLRDDIRNNPGRFTLFTVLGFGLLISVAAFYALFIDQDTLRTALQDTIKYNFQNQGYGSTALNRTSALTFWWQQQGLSDPSGFFFGHGLGSSFSAGLGGVISGHISAAFPGYGIDLTTASTLLWDLGVIGLLLYLAILAFAWIAANHLYKNSIDPTVRADALAIQAAIALFGLFIVYRNSPLNFMPWEIIIYMTLGYLSYLYRMNGGLPNSQPRHEPPFGLHRRKQ